MSASLTDWIIDKFSRFLMKSRSPTYKDFYCDFDKMCRNAQPGDVLLIQGRNRISNIIRHVTLSPWTHAALYIGRVNDIEDPKSHEIASRFCVDHLGRQLIVESNLGCGTILSDIKRYEDYPIRILRPQQLTKEDTNKIVQFAIGKLGTQYDVRQILDLARLLFPWGFFPKRWRSTLFEHNALQPTKDICSSMIAEAFQSVEYPILPLIESGYEKEIEFIWRNNRLYTPRDFDYSPYFDLKRYPFFPLEKPGEYHHLPWMKNVISNDEGLNFISVSPSIQKFFTSPAYAVIGASTDRNKFGNKVLRCYLQQHKKVYPVNNHEKTIEGLSCYHQIADIPSTVKSISIVTPPAVTETIVDEAIQHGIQNIWMQPGSESPLAIEKCEKNKINVIADGSCILKVLRFQE